MHIWKLKVLINIEQKTELENLNKFKWICFTFFCEFCFINSFHVWPDRRSSPWIFNVHFAGIFFSMVTFKCPIFYLYLSLRAPDALTNFPFQSILMLKKFLFLGDEGNFIKNDKTLMAEHNLATEINQKTKQFAHLNNFFGWTWTYEIRSQSSDESFKLTRCSLSIKFVMWCFVLTLHIMTLMCVTRTFMKCTLVNYSSFITSKELFSFANWIACEHIKFCQSGSRRCTTCSRSQFFFSSWVFFFYFYF